MMRYVVFQHFDDESLRSTIVRRCIKLGYSRLSDYKTVTLDTIDGKLLNTNNYDPDNPLDFHETGDLNKLFSSDYYKFNQTIMIGDVKVEFFDSGIKVGCKTVTKETIKEIASRFYQVLPKETKCIN